MFITFSQSHFSFGQQYDVALQSGHPKDYENRAGISLVKYSADGKHLITGGWYGNVIIWEIATGKLIKEINYSAKDVALVGAVIENGFLKANSESRGLRIFISQQINGAPHFQEYTRPVEVNGLEDIRIVRAPDFSLNSNYLICNRHGVDYNRTTSLP